MQTSEQEQFRFRNETDGNCLAPRGVLPTIYSAIASSLHWKSVFRRLELHSISCAVQKDLHPVQSGHGLKDPKCFQVSELYIWRSFINVFSVILCQKQREEQWQRAVSGKRKTRGLRGDGEDGEGEMRWEWVWDALDDQSETSHWGC